MVTGQFDFFGILLQSVTAQLVELPSAFTSALQVPHGAATWRWSSDTYHSSPNLAFFISTARQRLDLSAGSSSPHAWRAVLIAMVLLVTGTSLAARKDATKIPFGFLAV
jgi:hypothetical protein